MLMHQLSLHNSLSDMQSQGRPFYFSRQGVGTVFTCLGVYKIYDKSQCKLPTRKSCPLFASMINAIVTYKHAAVFGSEIRLVCPVLENVVGMCSVMRSVTWSVMCRECGQ